MNKVLEEMALKSELIHQRKKFPFGSTENYLNNNLPLQFGESFNFFYKTYWSSVLNFDQLKNFEIFYTQFNFENILLDYENQTASFFIRDKRYHLFVRAKRFKLQENLEREKCKCIKALR